MVQCAANGEIFKKIMSLLPSVGSAVFSLLSLVAADDEMSTTKSEERKSRRSSILKAPKPRQPLQNVELNASSVENSPTTSTHKIKRRVSFAEKKHVKEFCDSMEQGTVWDSTYEENELSHRNSQNSNDENTATVELPNESSKSHPRASIASGPSDESGLKSRHSSSSTKNPSISDLNPTPAACEPAIEDSVFGTAPTRIPYPTNHFGSIKARRSLSVSDCFADRNAIVEISAFRARADTYPATIDSRTRQALPDGRPNLEYATGAGEDRNDVVPMEETMIGAALVEPRPFVETVPRASIIAFVDESPTSEDPAIPSAGSIGDPKLDEEIVRIAKISVEHEKFTIFHDTSMEITESVTNLATARRPARSLVVESREESSSVATEIRTFEAKTVEFKDTLPETVPGSTRPSIISFIDQSSTSNAPAIPSIGPIVDSKLDEEIGRISKSSVEHEKFTIFHDTSMEITEAVSNFAKKRSVVESREESVVVAAESTMFGAKAVELTEAVCKTVAHPSFDELDPRERVLLRDKSISHRDKSMNFTEVVLTTSGSGKQRDSSTERTKMFERKSGDFKDVVGNVAGVKNTRKSLMDGTKIFEDKSIDFTDIVGNVAGIENLRKSPTERTRLFHDKSMEFTDAIGNIRNMKQREKSPTARTKIYHDNSMEFTDAVGNVRITKQREKSPTERTKIYHDNSMEFTDAVGNVRITNQREKSPSERTKIFHDNSMEITAAVGDVRITKQRQLPMERTKIFHDESIDFTDVVGKVTGVENARKSLTDRTEIFHDEYVDFTENVGKVAGVEDARKSPTERTKIFHDKSMEFTAAVQNVRTTTQREKSPTERTKIFHDKSMEFTAAVQNVRTTTQREKSPTERTKIFHDKSMEFTATVQNVRTTTQREKSHTERTKIFHDESIDFTEVVGKVAGVENARKSPTEKTKIFHDKSMEFTAAVQNVRTTTQREKSPTERTKIFHDESIDFTEVVGKVAGVENARKSPTEKTKIFHDRSMEFTAAVQNVRTTTQREKSPTERTKIFHDKSMEFTAAVGDVRIIKRREKSPTEITKIFHDKSMEFTAAVGDVQIMKRREKSPTERAKIFHNESIDFTEVVGQVPRIEDPRISSMNRSTIINDKSVDFTNIARNVPSTENSRKSRSEQTTLFHDKSMEFTDAVQSDPNTKQRKKSPTERTTVFHNESVDFTEVVRNVPCTDERTKRESSPGRSTMFHNAPNLMEIVPGVRSAEKSLPDDPRPASSSIFRDRTEASLEFNSSIEKLRHEDSLARPESEEINILQNRQPHDVPDVVQKMLRAPTLSSRESSYALDARMAIVAKTFVPSVQKPRSVDPELEIRSPLRKRMKSIGNQSTDLTAAVSFIKLGGKKAQPSDESSDDGSTPTPEVVGERFSEETSDFRNESMEATEVVAESFPRESHSARILYPSSAEEIPIFRSNSAGATFVLPGSAGSDCDDDSDRRRNTTLLDDASMEITGVIPGIVRAENIDIEENPKTTIFHDQSMEITVAVSRPALSRFVPTSSETRLPDNGGAGNILRDDSMELTAAVQPASSAKARIYARENEAVHCRDPSKFDHDGKTVLFRDDCMELTGAVGLNPRTEAPFVDQENCPIGAEDFPPRGARLFEHESRIAGFNSNIGETRTTVFRDHSMELTGAVRPASNTKEQTCANEDEAVHWSDPTKFDQEGKTAFFRDDGMELTGAVGFNSRPDVPLADKENCPSGAENFRPRGARLFEDESRIASKSEWLGKRKSFRCSSSQRNEEALRVRAESEEQNQVENFGSDDVTGIVAFSSQINDNEYESGAVERDYRISGNNSGALILGNESLEMTGVVPWPADLDVNRRSRPAGGTNDLQIVDKIPQRSSQSQVVKELFQKPISSEVYTAEKIKPVSVNERTGTADLEAEIRKLAESFALKDESGFDQATFLRQQARCMEDYEANSTASQDCEPLTQSVRAIERSASNGSSDSEKSNDWERSPDTKNANASGRDVSAAVSQCFSSKSLEELRNRAYSVGKFQPETTGYELTAAISMPGSDDFHRTIMLEDLQAVEPPSFLGDLADSVRSLGSMSELPTECGIGGKMADGEMPRVRQAISPIWEDMPNASLDSEPTIPDITETVNMDGIVDERRNENSGERMDRKKLSRTQTCASSSEINDERTKNHRRSSTGLTTADEFSSESADGPSEKLRRGESVLPTEGKVEKSTKLTDIDRSWDSKNFASSTVIVDDFTRQMMRRFVDESLVVLESSLSDELPSAIAANEEENIGTSICAEDAAYDIAMETEASLPSKSPFDALQEIIKNLAGSSETIWSIIRFDEKMLAFNFFSNSIVLVIHFNETSSAITNPIKVIGVLSQLVEDGTDPGVSLAHSLIMKKVDSASLTRCYRTYEDIPQMLDFVTTEVKLGMDFMFELDRLRNRNVMEIYGNRIIIMVRSSDINAGIILKLTIDIKPFAEINSNDITISCILGSDKVRENDIKKLITNIKRDHRFLRFYMNDVKDYVDLMAETGYSASSGTGCD